MLFLMKWFNENIGFPFRWRCLVRYLSPYLWDSKNVLDFGASCGRLANELSKKLPNINFIGVDTHVQPKTFIPIHKYDWNIIPFNDDSFDCVMIIDVLHHDQNPINILKEAKRVTKKYILIKDHYWNNRLDFLILKYFDYFGNKPYWVALPYNFFKITEWENIIKRIDMKIVKSQIFNFGMIDPSKHIIYLIEK